MVVMYVHIAYCVMYIFYAEILSVWTLVESVHTYRATIGSDGIGCSESK